jgi:hypothetical protein
MKTDSLPSSFRDAPQGAGSESITTIVSMDTLMCTSKLALRALRNDIQYEVTP